LFQQVIDIHRGNLLTAIVTVIRYNSKCSPWFYAIETRPHLTFDKLAKRLRQGRQSCGFGLLSPWIGLYGPEWYNFSAGLVPH
jgi:hypothetical protein